MAKAKEAPRRFDPPAFMDDFAHIKGQLQAWSDAVSGWFDEAIDSEKPVLHEGDPCQYYNQVTDPRPEPKLDQEVVWIAFPKTLRMIYGAKAYEIADQLYPLTQNPDGDGGFFSGPEWEKLFYRPLDEYCEWRLTTDDQGRIVRVTFTSEPPEYWMALHGDELPDMDGNPKYKMPGDKDLLVHLYRSLVDPRVNLEDLECPFDFHDQRNKQVIYRRGSYNPYNKWNSTHGIMHLGQPNNTLTAEIKLGADATILRVDPAGNPVTLPEPLVCGAAYGGPNRTSDPTIGSSVNDIARLGAFVTIKNPVGLYMDSIDLAGFETPDGKPVTEDYFRIVRGRAGMIERAVFEVPAGVRYSVSDLRVGGRPIRFGGQIAEHIKVKLVGEACAIGHFSNTPVPIDSKCCIGKDHPFVLGRSVAIDEPCPDGFAAAFTQGGTPQARRAAAAPFAALMAAARPRRPRVHHARHRVR